MKEFLEKRWNITGGWVQIGLILLVFALTGSSSVFIGKFVLSFVGITPETNAWVRVPFRIVSVFLIYQVLLLWIGFLFGQFAFFYAFEKKMWDRILSLFGKKT